MVILTMEEAIMVYNSYLDNIEAVSIDIRKLRAHLVQLKRLVKYEDPNQHALPLSIDLIEEHLEEVEKELDWYYEVRKEQK